MKAESIFRVVWESRSPDGFPETIGFGGEHTEPAPALGEAHARNLLLGERSSSQWSVRGPQDELEGFEINAEDVYEVLIQLGLGETEAEELIQD